MRKTELSFEIDQLTNSIINSVSGDILETDLLLLTNENFKGYKKKEWLFDWKKEIDDIQKKVFKLVIKGNPDVIQGLISFSDYKDHIFMHLIENARFNKGDKKLYKGVAGNMVAFACKTAFDLNYDGVVSFIAKTELIKHYEKTLGAQRFKGNQMFINTPESFNLVQLYFKDFTL